MKPNVFISYHSDNAKQARAVEAFLTQAGCQARTIPEDFVAEDKTPQHIMQDLVRRFIDPSDVLVCIIGPATAGTAYADNELHHALKGGPHVRKGIVALLMENTGITLAKIRPGDPKTEAVVPERLRRNLGYAEFAFFSTYRSLEAMMAKALKKARDAAMDVMNEPLPIPLKKGLYHHQ